MILINNDLKLYYHVDYNYKKNCEVITTVNSIEVVRLTLWFFLNYKHIASENKF